MGLSRKKLREIFESSIVQNLEEEMIVKLFGNIQSKRKALYDFLNDSEKGVGYFTMTPATLNEFGLSTLTLAQRKKILGKLPSEVRSLLPDKFEPAVYHDKEGRMYKYEDEQDVLTQWIWTVAIPKSKTDVLDFPSLGARLTLFKKKSTSNKQNSLEFEVVDIVAHNYRNTTIILLKEIKE